MYEMTEHEIIPKSEFPSWKNKNESFLHPTSCPVLLLTFTHSILGISLIKQQCLNSATVQKRES